MKDLRDLKDLTIHDVKPISDEVVFLNLKLLSLGWGVKVMLRIIQNLLPVMCLLFCTLGCQFHSAELLIEISLFHLTPRP